MTLTKLVIAFLIALFFLPNLKNESSKAREQVVPPSAPSVTTSETPKVTETPVVEPTEIPEPVLTTPEQWMTAAGIPQTEWWAVDYIISHESTWNPQAINPSSGSCGLAQQLPCGKWSHQWNDPVGALIDANAYALERYGSWTNAYYFWVNNHWW